MQLCQTLILIFYFFFKSLGKKLRPPLSLNPGSVPGHKVILSLQKSHTTILASNQRMHDYHSLTLFMLKAFM